MHSADTRSARVSRGWPGFVGTRWLGAAGWPPTAAGWSPLFLLALCIPLFLAAYQVERPIAVDVGAAGAGGKVRRAWQLFFTMLPVALYGGVTVVWLWRRGRAGQVVAVHCCALIAAQGWWLWFQRIAYAGQVVN